MWKSSIHVKVLLVPFFGEDVEETVVLPKGTATRWSEMMSVLQDSFKQLLSSYATYLDEEGAVITITTDAELQEALTSKVRSFTVSPQLSSERQVDGWQYLNSPSQEVEHQSWSNELHFWVNGEEVRLTNPSPSITLLDWLRESKGLTGTHVGCGEGGCGICTVALVLPSGEAVPINSCLRRLCAVDGCHVVNTQGLGSVKGELHPLQKAIADGNGSQCGFCTPGWVMNMYSLLEKNATPSKEVVEQNFDGNLCRCTGYRPILDSFGDFAEGGKCCGSHKSVPLPSGMQDHEVTPLHFTDVATGEEYYRPVTVTQIMDVSKKASRDNKQVRYMCGNTAVGVEKYLTKDPQYANTAFIDLNFVAEFSESRVGQFGFHVGSAVSIESLISQLEQGDDAFKAYADHLKRIASVQIRSVASWAGNLMLCRESALKKDFSYFPSDLVLVLATAHASVKVLVEGRPRIMGVLDLMQLPGSVVVLSATIPQACKHSFVKTYKMMKRHVFSHAIVNFGANLTLNPDRTVRSATVILGGATSTIMAAGRTEMALVHKPMNEATLIAAITALESDIDASPSTGELDSMAYKKSTAVGFLHKMFMAVADFHGTLPHREKSGIVPFTSANARPVSSGAVDFATVPSEAPVGTWTPKLEARIQATGEASYASDQHVGAWFAQVVVSRQCNAKLVGIDATEALRMPGVKDFVGSAAIPKGGANYWTGDFAMIPGSDMDKEKIFWEVNDTIPYVGAQLGVVVAETWAQAHEAAKAVKQAYVSLGPPVTTTVDAQRRGMTATRNQVEQVKKSGHLAKLLRGSPGVQRDRPPAMVRASSSLSAQSTLKTGEQVHFQLETKSVCAVPCDGDCMEIFVSGQCRDLEQSAVCLALGVPRSQVNVVNTRVGGAFGGKILCQLATCCAVAVAARKLKRPVRLQNERRNDMQMTGLRNSMDFDYDISFDADGKLDACDVKVVVDAGWIPGIGPLFLNSVEEEGDAVFKFPGGLKTSGQVLITNKAAISAMRAPATMQTSIFTSAALEHVAKTVGKDLDEIMELNMYQVGDTTLAGDVLGSHTYNYTIPQLWTTIQEEARYQERKSAVEAYNKANKWTKKGIAIVVSKLNLASSGFLMGAHVTAYVDGTVHVSTGGVEMGQGLNTKVALCVAMTLGIPVEHVRAEGGDTQLCGNNSITGGSGTSESCCNAAMQAASTLKQRIQDSLNSGVSWTDALQMAKANGVCLQAEGWFDGIAFSSGNTYAVYGAGITEVLLDVQTGETRLERVDLKMDLGTQLDAAVDIGQIQGGFVQSLGYLFTEETRWDANGEQMFCGTWEYKVPTAYDIPVEFNVSLLKNAPNPGAIALNSKCVAEPAMSLIPAPFLAVKKAIYAAREEFGLGSAWFPLSAPLSPEAIRSAIGIDSKHMASPTA